VRIDQVRKEATKDDDPDIIVAKVECVEDD
jgi:hypothetical protein